jgi:hypothetical protein
LAREPEKWHYLVGFAITLFAVYQLYQWYAVGQMYYRGISGGIYISYNEYPGRFTFVAIVYLSVLLLFGGGLLYTFVSNLPRQRRRPK